MGEVEEEGEELNKGKRTTTCIHGQQSLEVRQNAL